MIKKYWWVKQDHYKEIHKGEEGDIENVIFWFRIEAFFKKWAKWPDWKKLTLILNLKLNVLPITKKNKGNGWGKKIKDEKN